MTDTQKLDALDKLIVAVEAGHVNPWQWEAAIPAPIGAKSDARAAFLGSLDAALALHNALLPGWGWDTGEGSSVKSIAQVWESGKHKAISARTEGPARAWLLAILKAYRAQVAG